MKYTVKNTGTLLETVMNLFHGVSRQKAKQIIGYSDFILDGKDISRNPKQIVQAGNILEIIPAKKDNSGKQVPSYRNPVVVYYEDSYLIIALKPAGILSCGNRELAVNNSFHKVLEAFLTERYQKKTRLWIVHRLDREVEGLLLFAKSENMQHQIKDIWSSVQKKYLALTENMPDPTSGIIENWLIDTSSQKTIASEKEVPGSKYAKTEYRYLRTIKKYHLVEIVLHTGRRHQIRVHLAGIHCPVVGDRKYGADASVIRQIRLASVSLEFIHPVTYKLIKVEYHPPKRFFNPAQKEDEKYRIL